MTAGADASVNRTARWAGALYLAMAPFSLLGVLYVRAVRVVPRDAAATASHILASEWLFRASTVSLVISQILFILLVMTLYRLLEAVNKRHAVLMVILVLVQVPVLCLNELNHLAALRLLSRPTDGAFTVAQLQAQAMLLLQMRETGILVAQVFMGLWLLPLGFLVFRSGFLPKLLGILLVIAGAGYVIDWLTQLQFHGVPTVSQFTFWGELVFALWLLIKGVNVDGWRRLMIARAKGAA